MRELIHRPRLTFTYPNSPDGHDIFPKLYAVLKPTTLVALGFSTAEVMAYSKPKGYVATLMRYAYFTVPTVGMASAYVLTLNLAANIRNKDDAINWGLGGMAAGGVFGAYIRSSPGGWAMAFALAIAGMLKKRSLETNFPLLPFADMTNIVFAGRHDYSLAKDPRDSEK